MLNGSPLNGALLNGSAGRFRQIQITPAPAFVWSVWLTLGGADVTARLVGQISIDREEGAAAIAEFALHYAPGDAVPVDLANREVTIDLISSTAGVTRQDRLFTGVVAEPRWDALARSMRITATDNLQQRVEALSVAQIDALIGGQWSADVFEAPDGRSRWDYAQERLQSLPASLDCSAGGALRVTGWYAEPTAHYRFGPGSTLYESIAVELAQLSAVTNRVELEIAYRYSRFREYRQTYNWRHPGTQGLDGIAGFCAWRPESTELPDIDMVIGSVGNGGQVPVSATWYRLPGTLANPCGNGAAWINNNENLLLGASWVGATRWVQTVTETYRLTLATAAGQLDGQQVISRSGVSFEIAAPDGWEDSLIEIDGTAPGNTALGGADASLGDPGDRDDETRRAAAIALELAIAHTEIVAAHRKTTVGWSVPTPMALGIDLTHTLELDDQYTRARGKCSRRRDLLDPDSGDCTTTLTVSVMRGGGDSDPLDVPARPGALPGGDGGSAGTGTSGALVTQLGGKFTSPAYDDAQDGFAGNYSIAQDSTLERFPRRLDITADEIPADQRDEHTAEVAIVYRVGIPNDLLEL